MALMNDIGVEQARARFLSRAIQMCCGKNWPGLTRRASLPFGSGRLLDANASEKGQGAHLVRQMVTEIRTAGGAQAIEWLLMDALYADGPLLAWLEHACGIHALVRLPEDRLLFQNLQGLAEGGLLEWETRTDVRYVSGCKQVRRVSIAQFWCKAFHYQPEDK